MTGKFSEALCAMCFLELHQRLNTSANRTFSSHIKGANRMRKKTNQIPHLSKVMNIRVPNSLFLEIVQETKRLDLTASHFGRLAMTKFLKEVSGRKNLYEATKASS